MRTRLLVGGLLLGCYTSSDAGDDRVDAALADAGARDAPSAARDAGPERPRVDAGSPWMDAGGPSVADAGPDIPDEWVPITPEQAECFGLTDPACAACHIVPGTDEWVLRPGFAPPVPNGIVVEPRDCL